MSSLETPNSWILKEADILNCKKQLEGVQEFTSVFLGTCMTLVNLANTFKSNGLEDD